MHLQGIEHQGCPGSQEPHLKKIHLAERMLAEGHAQAVQRRPTQSYHTVLTAVT